MWLSKASAKLEMSAEDRRMYAAEKEDNFRWIAQILASYSKIHLKGSDKVNPAEKAQIFELGQFAELVYTDVPMSTLISHYEDLSVEGFPLEFYTALRDAQLERDVEGQVGKLPAAIIYRPAARQIVVPVCGTKSGCHALKDVKFLKRPHPSKRGLVHSGFWELYSGVREALVSGLKDATEKYSNEVSEIVLAGHSMGGAVSYLFAMDLLADTDAGPLQSGIPLKLITYGMPRVGDQGLVDYWESLVQGYRNKHGDSSIVEWALRTYNDGVPTLPPIALGYRHFPKAPIYATGEDLYHIPSSEREHSLFHVDQSDQGDFGNGPVNITRWPKGGHNYYGGRDLEGFRRRTSWLQKSGIGTDDKWADNYIAFVDNFAKLYP